nr:MAG: hypothetical protein [Bacteriophage sp.]
MPPFKVYKVMQSEKQQLYEKSSNPSAFIPIDSILYEVTDNTFISSRDFEEAKILVNAGAINKIKYKDVVYVCQAISVSNEINTIHCESIIYENNIIKRLILEWKDNNKTITIIDLFNISNQIIKSYDINTIIMLLTNDGTPTEVLNAINTTFTNFDGFVAAIGKPNSVFYNNNYGKFYIRYTGDVITIQWSNSNTINHISLHNDGSYAYNTIQIVDQTLYRLSNLTIDPIVNPKIWIGTATQYAAIAQKDNNTTYIVKSDA